MYLSSPDCSDPRAHHGTEDSAMTLYFGVCPVYSLARSVMLPSTDNIGPIIIIIVTKFPCNQESFVLILYQT